jgi:hypothetical protein
MGGDDNQADSTITRNIRVLLERIEENTGQLRSLQKARLERAKKLLLELRFPRFWSQRKKGAEE